MSRLLIVAFALLYQPAMGAELKLEGNATEHKLVHVTSDKSGTFVVIGPDLLTMKVQASLGDFKMGSTSLNLREALILDGGKSVAFTGPPGAYVVLQVVQGEEQPIHLVVTVMPSGAATPPPTVFTPPPPPVPESPRPPAAPTPLQLPAGVYGLAKFAFDQAQNVPIAARSKAAALGANFYQVSKSGDLGKYPDGQSAVNALNSLNEKVTPGDGPWSSFFDAINVRLKRLHEENQFTLGDYFIAWGEIAVGLQAVK